jgi:hypothetical protein
VVVDISYTGTGGKNSMQGVLTVKP